MAQSFSWIIVGNKPGGALAPSSAYANANTRVRLDVPDVARPVTVLGDDPEDAAVEAVGNRVASRPPGPAADRLQDRSPRGRKPEAKKPADDGIDHVLRRPAGKLPLRLTVTRHDFTTYPPAAIPPGLGGLDRGRGLGRRFVVEPPLKLARGPQYRPSLRPCGWRWSSAISLSLARSILPVGLSGISSRKTISSGAL